MNDPVRFEKDILCEICGCHGAYPFSTAQVRADCCQIQGACCALEDRPESRFQE